MKLIIDISKELYQMCKSCLGDADCIESAIAHGIPLDDVKAEISDEYANTHHMYPDYASGLSHAYAIINKHIYKAESEEK